MTKWLMVGYITGTALHWLFKAWAVKASPASTVTTWGEWLRRNRRALAVRLIIVTGIFVAWCCDPAWVKDWLGIPLNPGTALLYGFVFDNVLYLAAAKFKFLDGQIPGYNGDCPVVEPAPTPEPPIPQRGQGNP